MENIIKIYQAIYSIDYEFYNHFKAKWEKEHYQIVDRFKGNKKNIKDEIKKKFYNELSLDSN